METARSELLPVFLDPPLLAEGERTLQEVRLQPRLRRLLPPEQLHGGARPTAAPDLKPRGRLLAGLPDPE